MTSQFIWRKTEKTFALIEWSGIKLKGSLPHEYVCGDGPKFWYASPKTNDEFIQLDADAAKALYANMFPGRLYVGTVLTHREHELLKKYLALAGARLSRIKAEVDRSSRVVDEV